MDIAGPKDHTENALDSDENGAQDKHVTVTNERGWGPQRPNSCLFLEIKSYAQCKHKQHAGSHFQGEPAHINHVAH